MHRIGIVVPVYNTQQYVRQCIESILSQAFHEISLVIVDDGSTDASGKICDEYARTDSRVKVIHQNNQGMLKARYIGLLNVGECDYATTIDSDDWIAKNIYSSLTSYMDNDIDVITFSIARWFDSTKCAKAEEKFETGVYDRKRISNELFPTLLWNEKEESYGLDPSLCNKLFKKDVFLKYLKMASSLEIDYGQDAAVLYPLLSDIKSIAITDEGTYYHRQRIGGNIAPYLLDSCFYEKTFKLYRYLTSFYSNNNSMIKQIEYFYTYSLELRLEIVYGEKAIKMKYIFPFKDQCYGKRIILYGAGVVGKSYYDCIKKDGNCTVVGWVDSKTNNFKYKKFEIKKPCAIYEMDFDFIVIAVLDRNLAAEIFSDLRHMGIDSCRIIC